MSSEPEFQAHYRCVWCHGLKAKADTMQVDDKRICKDGDCKDAYYKATRPRPVRKYGAYDDGHC